MKDFKANSDIIMARCKYMRTVVPLKDSLTEQHPVVEIPDMTPEQFEPYFEYIHTDTMNCFKTVDELVNGLYAGKRFNTPPLVTKCREKLQKLIQQDPIENGLKFLKRTEDFIHEDEEFNLIEITKPIFEQSTTEILYSESFENANYETMKRVIGNNNSDAEPLERLEALNDWAEQRLRNKNVEVNQKSKFDLCSEVLFTIPVQDIPLSQLHTKVKKMKLLPDELLMETASYHFEEDIDLPFHKTNYFEFNSEATNEFTEYHQNTYKYQRQAKSKMIIDQNDYKSDAYRVGYRITSNDIYVAEEAGTKWYVNYYPCGTKDKWKHDIGVYLRNKSIDEINRGQVHAHCTFQIVAENRELVRKELSYVYSTGCAHGYRSLISRSSLPARFTLTTYIQWSPVPQIFYQPSKPRNIDGKKVSTVAARWNIQGYTAGRQNHSLRSPLFGLDGLLWNIYTDSPRVQLMRLLDSRISVNAKVTFTFAGRNHQEQDDEYEEKEYRDLTTSKTFSLPEVHRNNPEFTVQIDYQL